jgi:phenylacetic acid degradation operon negative regulatory protein
MLTLYGDYVRYRGSEIGIGSLIRLLANFDLSELSIRSAVSRMCRAGLLKVRREGARSFYSLSADGLALLQDGERRIFERKGPHWNGEWSVVVYFIPEEQRESRDTLRRELTWLGYGPLNTATWISPHDLSKDVAKLARNLRIKEFMQVFQAKHLGFSDPKSLVARGWDLERIHRGYADFLGRYRGKKDEHLRRLNDGTSIEPSECFAERFKLIHEYRRLPFFDPDLPEELLPGNWLRSEAGALFNEYHDLLADKANRYFDSVLKAY